MEGPSQLKGKTVALFVLSVSFFLGLAIMDYTIMHGHIAADSAEWQYPNWLYKYWVALGMVVVVFASALAVALYSNGASKRFATAAFATVVLLFIGGFLDLFFYMFTAIRGEPYSFDYWSAQYKWFGSWTWPQQIAWTLLCLISIYVVWKWALRKR
jgi:hypothetical protein